MLSLTARRTSGWEVRTTCESSHNCKITNPQHWSKSVVGHKDSGREEREDKIYLPHGMGEEKYCFITILTLSFSQSRDNFSTSGS